MQLRRSLRSMPVEDIYGSRDDMTG
jgi:hypothetical protein